ncbi:hypothetical protein TNCT_584421 [Trichonephila clavata]|uniref:Uncharacterized protein n=1 Tax=Trichonephila clavata TaxID=2740835 RepID=A0A8X6LRZ8_TRICU|nr:hypothetical protein TNCT_584421 [Trichonephila clavata]
MCPRQIRIEFHSLLDRRHETWNRIPRFLNYNLQANGFETSNELVNPLRRNHSPISNSGLITITGSGPASASNYRGVMSRGTLSKFSGQVTSERVSVLHILWDLRCEARRVIDYVIGEPLKRSRRTAFRSLNRKRQRV